MDEFLHYIQLRHEDDKKHLNAANELLELLYFSHVKPITRFLTRSTEYRIAQDLLNLKKAVFTGNLDIAELRTEFVKDLVSDYGFSSPLSEESKKTIDYNILKEYRYYVTAIFIADVVNRQARQERLRWLTTTILGLVAALAYYDWLIN